MMPEPARYISPVTSACLAVLVFASASLDACTIWGAAGTDASGGTIVSKNRDWKPDHTQVLKFCRGGEGHDYFGLFSVYAEKSAEPGVAAGVNEKALTVFTAAAGCVPRSMWKNRSGKRGVTTTLLSGYATCDEVLEKREALFPSARPGFVMISDRKKILMVEVGLDGKYAIKTIENGFVTHANHFIEKTLEEFNIAPGESSPTRLDRITHLMNRAPKPCGTESFAVMSKDQHDGPDNSLWRTGKVARTLASWIVETPARGAPKLRVVIANPGQQEQIHYLVLDDDFWRGDGQR